MGRRAIVLMLFVLGCASLFGQDAQDQDDFKPPEGLDEGWYARIETRFGRIIARLLPEQAPQSVAHFAALAEGRLEWADGVTGEKMKGHYYDGVRVYRVDVGALFEAGDRTPSGRQAPSLYLPLGEGRGPINFHGGYRLGMVRTGSMVSAVKFVVTLARQRRLTGYTPCFGQIVAGKDAVVEMTTVKTHSSGVPLEPLIIDKVRIFRVGEPPPLPEPVRYLPQREPISLKPPKP